MANVVDGHLFVVGIYPVHDAIIADTNPVETFRPGKFDGLVGKRIGFQILNALQDFLNQRRKQSPKILVNGRSQNDVIRGHPA